MARDLRSLVGAGSARELQEKLESWHQDYELNSSGENLSRCCELLELNTAIQKQLFSILNEASQEDECAGAVKSCLLPKICCSAPRCPSLSQDSAGGELQLRDLACKPKCRLRDLEDKLAETRVELSQMEQDLRTSRANECKTMKKLKQLCDYEQQLQLLQDEISILDCQKSVLRSRLARSCSPPLCSKPCSPCSKPCSPCSKPCSPCSKPCGPCGPCIPCDPCDPCSPCSPCGPCGPCIPCNPCDPCSPCSPCDPCSPCSPCVPCVPCVPCDPCDPCSPCVPCKPCDPCDPCNPCNPCIPCKPCDPCNPCSPCKPCDPCNPCIPCNPCDPCSPCIPCKPCDPCNPCSPCKPCDPCDPCNPCKPCDPCNPCSPCKPCDPCNPCSPCKPCDPCNPCSPCKPCDPCNPCSPCKPCDPCSPCIPCNPCDPCNPCLPCKPCDPCNPCLPCKPCDPCNPCSPCKPYDPCDPCNPCNPCISVKICSPAQCRRVNASRRACLIARFNFIYAKDRLDAEIRLKKFICDIEMVQRIIYVAVLESFRAARKAFWKTKISVKQILAAGHCGGPAALEVAVLNYIACHKELFDVCCCVQEVVCCLNMSPKLLCPTDIDFNVINCFIRELCCLAFSMQTLIPPLDVSFGIDGELFNRNMYYRSCDSDFTAPFVAYHIWPALMENGCVIVKGEVVTRKMIQCYRRSKLRSRSCGCGRRLLPGQVTRSRSLSTVRFKTSRH